MLYYGSNILMIIYKPFNPNFFTTEQMFSTQNDCITELNVNFLLTSTIKRYFYVHEKLHDRIGQNGPLDLHVNVAMCDTI